MHHPGSQRFSVMSERIETCEPALRIAIAIFKEPPHGIGTRKTDHENG